MQPIRRHLPEVSDHGFYNAARFLEQTALASQVAGIVIGDRLAICGLIYVQFAVSYVFIHHFDYVAYSEGQRAAEPLGDFPSHCSVAMAAFRDNHFLYFQRLGFFDDALSNAFGFGSVAQENGIVGGVKHAQSPRFLGQVKDYRLWDNGMGSGQRYVEKAGSFLVHGYPGFGAAQTVLYFFLQLLYLL